MAAHDMPAAEIEVTEHLVRQLLAEQQPGLADRPLTLVANGWDNVIFRLGDDLVVRLPRRDAAAELVLNEHRWLPELESTLPIPISAPVHLGAPAAGYRWHWTIGPWFDGDVAADVTLDDVRSDAERLGAFLAALHVTAPSDAPVNPYRGHPVAELRGRFEERVEQLGSLVDRAALVRRFGELLDVDAFDGWSPWIHGDLHSANVIVADGAISAVIDWGDITAGDPACDFAVGWMLFDDADRIAFRRAAGARTPLDDSMWQRAEAWALHFAVMYLAHSADSPRFERMGRSLLMALGIDHPDSPTGYGGGERYP